jgi:glucokinase
MSLPAAMAGRRPVFKPMASACASHGSDGTEEAVTAVQVNPRGDERLLADIGGTNARFAWQRGSAGLIADLVSLRCAEYVTLADAIKHYLAIIGRDAPPRCSIAIANPVLGDEVQMTNHHWIFFDQCIEGAIRVQQVACAE